MKGCSDRTIATEHSGHLHLAPRTVTVIKTNTDKVLSVFLEETVQVAKRVASELISALTTLVFVQPSAY